ncbi:MAG: hypothetical protein LBG92_01230, partial [Prevotellaceae bacterium]|nr:hypothetical protein [Prevotellaceae bacterium]
VSIKANWFVVNRINPRKMSIVIEPNLTGKTRKFVFDISSGIHLIPIIITQSADSNTKSGQEYNFQYRNEIFPEIYYKFP